MKKIDKIRLMKKYRIKEVSGGVWGEGFFSGLEAANTYLQREKVSIKDIEKCS